MFWPDGSLTRIAEKTNIAIHELKKEVSGATAVNFSITEGKSWSNIARYLDPDSHFEERFDNDLKVAAVRGTVFEINLEKNYIHTVDHAITILDEKGEYITSLSAGGIADGDHVLKQSSPNVIDTAWETWNKESDAALMKERFEKAKKLFASFVRETSSVEKFQDFLRSLVGLSPMHMPFQVEFDGDQIGVQVESGALENLSKENVQNLVTLYESVSGLSNSGNTLDSKITLRKALLQSLSEKEQKKYLDSFARAALYESWDTLRSDIPEKTKVLRQSIDSYIGAGADTKSLAQIVSAVPKEELDSFNGKIENWKKQGFQIMSEKDWMIQTLEIDPEDIRSGIETLNDAMNGITKKLSP